MTSLLFSKIIVIPSPNVSQRKENPKGTLGSVSLSPRALLVSAGGRGGGSAASKHHSAGVNTISSGMSTRLWQGKW